MDYDSRQTWYIICIAKNLVNRKVSDQGKKANVDIVLCTFVSLFTQFILHYFGGNKEYLILSYVK